VLGTCVCIKKYNLASVFVNSVFIKADVWKVINTLASGYFRQFSNKNAWTHVALRGNIFAPVSLALFCRQALNKIVNVLCSANLLQLICHHGIDSVRGLDLLYCNNMLRPVGIMIINVTCSVFLTSVIPVTFGPIWSCFCRAK